MSEQQIPQPPATSDVFHDVPMGQPEYNPLAFLKVCESGFRVGMVTRTDHASGDLTDHLVSLTLDTATGSTHVHMNPEASEALARALLQTAQDVKRAEGVSATQGPPTQPRKKKARPPKGKGKKK